MFYWYLQVAGSLVAMAVEGEISQLEDGACFSGYVLGFFDKDSRARR